MRCSAARRPSPRWPACRAPRRSARGRSRAGLLEDGEDVVFAHDDVVLADEVHLGLGVLGDQDLVAGLDRGRLDRAVREPLAAANRDHQHLERLLLRGGGDEQAAGRLVVLGHAPGEDAIVERTDRHDGPAFASAGVLAGAAVAAGADGTWYADSASHCWSFLITGSLTPFQSSATPHLTTCASSDSLALSLSRASAASMRVSTLSPTSTLISSARRALMRDWRSGCSAIDDPSGVRLSVSARAVSDTARSAVIAAPSPVVSTRSPRLSCPCTRWSQAPRPCR